jgi:hypothetical protein
MRRAGEFISRDTGAGIRSVVAHRGLGVSERLLAAAMSSASQPLTTSSERARRSLLRFSSRTLAWTYGPLRRELRRVRCVDRVPLIGTDTPDAGVSSRPSKLVFDGDEVTDFWELVCCVSKGAVDSVLRRRDEQDGERPQFAHHSEPSA